MRNQSTVGWRMYTLLGLVPLFWGGAFPAAQHVVMEIPPLTAATIRFGTAGIILLVICFRSIIVARYEIKKMWFGLMIMSVTGIFGYNALFFIALQSTSAINGSLIMATTPVFMTAGAVLFLKEGWNVRLVIGLGLSIIGVILVITEGSPGKLLSLSFNKGDVLLILALFSWVTHGLVGKTVMKLIDPLVVTTLTMLVGTMGLAICSLVEGGMSAVFSMSFQAWTEMSYMSVFASVIAFFLWNQGVQKVGASRASLFMNMVPLHATWISVVFYSSEMSWEQMVGILIVISGVLLATVHAPSSTRRSKESVLLTERR